MKIWLLNEGTPGHTVQTAGLGAILSQSGEHQTEWLTCRLCLRGWLRPLARRLTADARGAWALRLATWLYPGLALPKVCTVDLVVSSCGQSAYLNRLLCQAFGARGIFIGEVAPFPAAWFDRVVTPVTNAAPNELLMPVIETGCSPESGNLAAEKFWPGPPPVNCWTLLLGGDSRSHRYVESDWEALAVGLEQLSKSYQIRWLVTSSRRTGTQVEEWLRRRLPTEILAESVWYGSDPRKAVAAFLAIGERIFVTQDSLTMMSEGLAMEKRVELLRPMNWKMPSDSFNARYIKRLATNDLIGITDLSNLSQYLPRDNAAFALQDLKTEFKERLLEWVGSVNRNQ